MTNDPPRPIEIAEKLRLPDDCPHPWSRIAIVFAGEHLALQCADCLAYMYSQGYPLIFDYAK